MKNNQRSSDWLLQLKGKILSCVYSLKLWLIFKLKPLSVSYDPSLYSEHACLVPNSTHSLLVADHGCELHNTPMWAAVTADAGADKSVASDGNFLQSCVMNRDRSDSIRHFLDFLLLFAWTLSHSWIPSMSAEEMFCIHKDLIYKKHFYAKQCI